MAEDSTDSAESTDSARLEEVSSQLREAEDRYLRMRADLDNVKKRSAQQQLEARKYAAAELASRLLPVLDDAERALEHVPEGIDETWLQGLRLTVQKLREVLASLGVEPIEAMGARFDPQQHEAVGSEESPEHPEGTVMRELRRGYRLQDRVLRPALVKLSRGPEER
jgi:molecular chaperone GrpE